MQTDWEAWNARSLAEEPIVRLILDGTVVRVRLDRKATSISLLVVLGVRADGQKVLLAIKSMGGESAEAWRTVLDDLIKRGLRRPEFLIVDGAPGLDKAIASVWKRAVLKDWMEPQPAPDEIVEDSAPGLGALPAHALDREQHLLAVLAHAENDQQRDGCLLYTSPSPRDS